MKKEKKISIPSCASCEVEIPKRICLSEDGISHKGCPTLTRNQVLSEANNEYDDTDIMEFSRQASIQESACYANRHEKPYVLQPQKTRILEICEFAERMGYKRLGIAFCVGLASEAKMVGEIFEANGFEVVSACCKAGRTSKEERIGIKDEEKIHRGTDEAMCNPIFQAKLLNHDKADFNILLGLCVGHDSLFFKYAEAPTTVLAVKDRVTGHNPLAAVYLSNSYYRKLRVS